MRTTVHLPPYRVEAVACNAQSSGIDWHLSAYGLPSLWQRCQGEGGRVGVLDSGVCKDHPSLLGAVVENRNFTRDESEYDSNGHGSHVAGILAGRGPILGVAPKAEIVSCKVLNNDGVGEMGAVARALLFAVEAGCNVIVMSLGSPVGCEKLKAALEVARKACVPVVCAAGNDGGSVSFPAAYHETIAVGAVDKLGRLCEFSARGREIDVAAPGYQIHSCWLDGGYATLSGTSMAAPFVAGVLALAVSQCGGARLHDAKDVLQKTARDAGATGRDNEYGWGLVSPAMVLESEVCQIL